MELNSETRHMIRLLAAGKKEEARDLAIAAQLRIRQTQAQLEAEFAFIQEIIHTDAPVPAAGGTQKIPVGASSKAERKHAALSVAHNLATSKADGLVSTDAIYAQMRKDGVQGMTKTGIGIMLNAHTSEWERVDKGLYRLIRPRSAAHVPSAAVPSPQASPPPAAPRDMVPRAEQQDPDDLPF